MIAKNLRKITQLRHELHQHPELSMHEENTAAILQAFLAENTSLTIVECEGWFYAVKSKDSAFAGQPPIAFRADMDALPIPETIDLPYASVNEGISHKCGHDGHCAALCGLALELGGMKTDRDVYLIFQPGEETGAGALRCRELIREKGIVEIYAFHNLGGYPEGSVVYRHGLTQPASEGLKISLIGTTSHASAPEKGNNPAPALAKIVMFAGKLTEAGKLTGPEKLLVPDELAEPVKPGMRLCTVTGIRLGNGDFGISPGEGEVCLTLRAEEEAQMRAMEGMLVRFARETADSAGLQMAYSIHDYFPETRNDDLCLERVLKAASKIAVSRHHLREIWRASEDFGYYLKECPGAMFYIGNGENYPALHTTDYDFNDRILETAVDLFLELAVN